MGATARYKGSHVTLNVQLDPLHGFVTFWLTGDISRQILRNHNLHLPPLSRLFSGAKFKECFALQLNVPRIVVERFAERVHTHREMELSFLHWNPKCYVDGVEGYSKGGMCLSKADYTLLGWKINNNLYVKFSGTKEWKGPLDPRPACANVVENDRVATPALQIMMESLPDSDFKRGAQQLFADMSDAKQQDSGVMNVPTFIGIVAGFSLVSVIVGFAIGQRTQAYNMDSYERVNE